MSDNSPVADLRDSLEAEVAEDMRDSLQAAGFKTLREAFEVMQRVREERDRALVSERAAIAAKLDLEAELVYMRQQLKEINELLDDAIEARMKHDNALAIGLDKLSAALAESREQESTAGIDLHHASRRLRRLLLETGEV